MCILKIKKCYSQIETHSQSTKISNNKNDAKIKNACPPMFTYNIPANIGANTAIKEFNEALIPEISPCLVSSTDLDNKAPMVGKLSDTPRFKK